MPTLNIATSKAPSRRLKALLGSGRKFSATSSKQRGDGYPDKLTARVSQDSGPQQPYRLGYGDGSEHVDDTGTFSSRRHLLARAILRSKGKSGRCTCMKITKDSCVGQASGCQGEMIVSQPRYINV